MLSRTFTVTAQLGLHARAAAKLVRVAAGFKSTLLLTRKDAGASADAKSILSVLMLAAVCGTELIATAEGEDENEAIEAIGVLFSTGFGEVQAGARNLPAEPSEIRWKGLGVSDGIAIGCVQRMHNGTKHVYRSRLQGGEIEHELRRFRAALRLAKRRLLAVKERAEQELGRDHAYVFDAHLLLLEDEKLIGDVENHIAREHANAEWALRSVADQLISAYSEIKDEYLRERGSDIEDVVQRLLAALSGESAPQRKLPDEAVIVSPDLLPSAVAELDFDRACAIATDSGGWTSHTAIIARGLGIPAVVGLRDFFRRARTGDMIVVDSDRGEVILHPSPATLERYRAEQTNRTKSVPVETAADQSPLRTQDGIEIRMRANVEVPAEFSGVRQYGAHGIGLYRSEFLLSRGGVMVSEDQQYAAYAEIAELAGDYGAIVRLFDLGGENARDLPAERERNPVLGLRAIRFGLRHEDVMRTQVRAILRAAASGKLDIVLPMVADVGDVRRARRIIEEEEVRLKDEQLPHGQVEIGAMIEVPSAVLTADKIARGVDFFELGTNDLVQYTLAVDRSSDEVADWFRTLHPSVLGSIARSLEAGKDAGIPVIVCGEMASTPAYAVLLVGLGAVDLSMTPTSIPRVRRALAGIDSRDAATMARACLDCATADEVENLVRESFHTKWPELFSLENLPKRRVEN
jgi:phosphoenolpyruvate-protein phosphotransferase (PTS system enzyme I)